MAIMERCSEAKNCYFWLERNNYALGRRGCKGECFTLFLLFNVQDVRPEFNQALIYCLFLVIEGNIYFFYKYLIFSSEMYSPHQNTNKTIKIHKVYKTHYITVRREPVMRHVLCIHVLFSCRISNLYPVII